MAKKILIFSLNYHPRFVGGAEVAIKEITDRIAPQEIEFHMVTLRFDSTLPRVEKIGNVLIHRIGFSRTNPSMADLKKFPLYLNKYVFQGAAPLYAMRLHWRYSYDGIWGMMAHSVGIATAIFKLFFPRVSYVLTLQEGDPPEYIERLARPAWPLFVRAFTSADAIQVISNFLGKWALKMGYAGVPVLIPNAVNIAHFSRTYPESEIQEFQTQIGKSPGDTFLISTSRLVYKNASDDVIRALVHLPPSVKFLVDGEGPDLEALERLAHELKLPATFLVFGKGAEPAEVEALVLGMGLKDRVSVFAFPPNHPRGYRFALRGEGPTLRAFYKKATAEKETITCTLPVAGPEEHEVPSLAKTAKDYRVVFFPQTGQEDMPKHLKACDIAIRPSRSEGMGNSFVEAMVAKLPVIGTPVGGIPDFLFDPEYTKGKQATGFLCEPNNPKSIAETVERIMKDPERTRAIAAYAATYATEHYDWDIIAREMRELFGRVLAR